MIHCQECSFTEIKLEHYSFTVMCPRNLSRIVHWLFLNTLLVFTDSIYPPNNGTFSDLKNISSFHLNNSKGFKNVEHMKTENPTIWSYIFPLILLCISALCNSIYITMIYAKRLEFENSTTILFWVFLLGVVLLWPLSAGIEGVTIPESARDKLLLAGIGICTTGQTYCYTLAARILNPSVLSTVETIGIPVFLAAQFFQHGFLPTNLILQIASIVVIFFVSVGLPILEFTTVNH